MIRRGAFETIGGFEDSFRGLGEDQAFLVKVHLKASVSVSGDCLSLYRMHPDSCCFTAIRNGRHEAGTRTLLDWVGDYLRKESVTDRRIWRAFRKAQLPYRYPRLTRLLGWGSGLARRAGRRSEFRKTAPSGAIQSSITACPNPVFLSGPFADRFPVGATTLSWTAGPAAEVEVRVDAPDGALLSRTAGAGKAATGNWVRDGTTFYLQDVTGGKPLVPEHTLAVTTVTVAAKPRKPAPPVGQVRFGSLRRLDPVSAEWGFDRGLPVDRHYIENFLASHASDIRGRVLEIGDDAYTRKFGGNSVARSDVLNLREGIPGTTIVGDLAGTPQIPSETFDCVILTQTLQCVYDVHAAVRTLHRILKPAGIVLATVPGISQTYDPQWGRNWCWNFTPLSARLLFEESFPPAQLKVAAFGNVLAAICFLEGIASEELLPEELGYGDPGYVVTIGVRAAKLGVE
jgi:hypothetical protein